MQITSCYWINQNGEKLDFLADVDLITINGADVERDINLAKTAGYNGSPFISASYPSRQILIIISLKSESEITRDGLASAVGESGEFYYEGKKIFGYVKSIKYAISCSDKNIQIEVQCPDPFFKSCNKKNETMTLTEPLLEFPLFFDEENGNMLSNRTGSVFKTITNGSSVDVYPIIEMTAFSTVQNPSLMNIHTYEKMQINTTLSAGEKIVIDTRVGYKTITRFNGYSEVGTNAFNLIADDFVFFPLYVGGNKLKFDAESGIEGLFITINYDSLFGGI